ncbi:MAG: hypothetical protein AAFR38_12045 [Planctomycetota bacterium]
MKFPSTLDPSALNVPRASASVGVSVTVKPGFVLLEIRSSSSMERSE